MVSRHEKVSNSRHSGLVKRIIFLPWWQPFNSFALKPFLFSLCLPFIFLLCKNVGGRHSCPGLPVWQALLKEISALSDLHKESFSQNKKGWKGEGCQKCYTLLKSPIYMIAMWNRGVCVSVFLFPFIVKTSPNWTK